MFLEDERLNSLMGLGEAMESFLQRYVNSFVKWEIVQYFHDHPGTPLKAEELARTLNRPAEQIRRELRELSADGLLARHASGKTTTYAYRLSDEKPKERELRELVNHFHTLCRSREGRLKVIYKILKSGKPLGE